MKECVQKLEDMKDVIIRSDSENVKKLFRSLRNALAHINILVDNENGNIKYVYLRDKLPNAPKFHTELKFSVEQLREFALYLSDKHLERHRNRLDKNIHGVGQNS